MTDKKAINALDPENTPAADDLLYLRKGGGSNVDRKVVLPADSVLRRSEGAQADHDAPATAEKLARLDRMDAATARAYSRSVGTAPDNLPDVASFAVTESGVVPEMIGQGAIVDIIENSSGTAVRWESGLQVCFNVLNISQLDTFALGATWSYPAIFTQQPALSASSLWGSAGGSLSSNDYASYGDATTRQVSVSNAEVRLGQMASEDFGSSDTLDVMAIAIGFYK